ncbi:uncharacterized protein LOC101670167 isoform X13 [Mustela putorius furo]|uniref:Uncharacterized protein LOC101670167 isoform X13 n=1 Tax=Mustela putorius furo TaxID=9669 RepID=A0A8U0UV03_MUSPF|nr:uncharacterized protein LOC101670167 isoform X13 [Mustela putorius furo]
MVLSVLASRQIFFYPFIRSSLLSLPKKPPSGHNLPEEGIGLCGLRDKSGDKFQATKAQGLFSRSLWSSFTARQSDILACLDGWDRRCVWTAIPSTQSPPPSRRYLQRASYLEGDAGHQRESFVHSANICGVPPMGQSCPAGLFQVTETEREGWVLRRGERGSCWATLPPPCLRCIFGRLSAVSREGGGVGGGAERRGIQDTTASGPQACRGDLEEHVSAGSHVDKVGHIWSMSQPHRSG